MGDGEFLEESVVLFDESLTELGGVCGLLDVHCVDLAGEDLAEIGDVALDGSGAVLGQVDDLGDGLAFDEEQATDLFLVGEGRPHVVDGTASGEELAVRGLPLGDVFADRGGCGLEHKREFGCGDAAALLIDLQAGAGDALTLDVSEAFTVATLLGFVLGQQGDDHRDHACLGDGLAVGGDFVFGDADPGGLALAQVRGGGEEAMDHLDDALHHRAPGAFAGKLRKLVGKEGFQGAGKGLLHRRAIGFEQVLLRGLRVGQPAWDGERIH